MTDLAGIVAEIAADMAGETDRGLVADYIPALARVSPDQFGIASFAFLFFGFGVAAMLILLLLPDV